MLVPCGCQGNRWSPDSDLVPVEAGPNAANYFFTGVNDDDEDEPVAAPKWTPESGTED